MNLENIKFTAQSTESLSIGSYLSKSDAFYLLETSSVVNFPFGESDKELVEFSVFTLDESLITSSLIKPTGTYTPFTGSYTNVQNEKVTYYHDTFSSDVIIVGSATQSMFLDVGSQLREYGINDGNYKIGIQLIRDIVGSSIDPSRKLIVDVISPSRTEVSLYPSSVRDSTNTSDVELLNEYEAFGRNKVQVKDVINDIIDSIKSPEFYNIYYKSKKTNLVGSNDLMFYYGFKKDTDVINFITDIYYGVGIGETKSSGQISQRDILGIYDQYYNWIHQNFSSITTFTELKDVYYSFFKYIVDKELNEITLYRPTNYDAIVKFLSDIYYTSIFEENINRIESNYNTFFRGYFTNFISTGEDYFSIVNVKMLDSTDSNVHDTLVLKLSEPLPSKILPGQTVCISNLFASPPIVQNMYYFTKSVVKTIPIRGPDFTSHVENEGNGTEMLSMETVIGQSGSLYDELFSKLSSKNESTADSIDYTKFENFITFSSAEIRLNAYDSKVQEIANNKKLISELNTKISLQPNDQFYLQDKTDLLNRNNEIEASFDGYEKFLQNNPSWHEEHLREYAGQTSASLYDRENQSSLINGLPEFISDDSDNVDYIKFVGMIGHYFDNISLFIKQFTDKNNHSSSTSSGISVDIVNEMLRSLGWEPEISRENLPILLSSFSKSDFDPSSPLYNKVGSISESDRNKIIWKRLLNALPFIYKTKGTEASINAIISCFGIPKNLIRIKEFGGINSTSDSSDESLYIFEGTKFEPYFSGSGEYFQSSWTGSAQTVEFNVSFDEGKINDEGKYFYLVNCSGIWNIGVIRNRGEGWGKVFFSVSDGSGSTKSVVTDKVPIFDENTYSIILRRNDPHPSFNLTSSTDLVIDQHPIQYDLMVKRAEDTRIVYAVSSSIILTGIYNSRFRQGSTISFGDIESPGTFWGSLDEIKIWESALSTERFDHHVLYRGAYDATDPQETVYENLLHISFERPIDLYSPSGSLILDNLSFRGDFPIFYANNFPKKMELVYEDPECALLNQEIPSFPYQFLQKSVRQTIKVPSYGASKFRSNKINFVEQTLTSPLSSNSRSSVPMSELTSIDSNKLGVYISPSDVENEEILKFFGQFELGDLIGDPSSVYESTYKKFEKFREIYYDQGLGNIDYQSFMNMVRSYLDKSMFKYIKSVVPARTKLIDGLLIEPTILERPKLQLKPLVKEYIDVRSGSIRNGELGITGIQDSNRSASIQIDYRGVGILNDVNHRFFSDNPDKYGFGVYSDDGVTFFNDEYYRADVVKKIKSYQIKRKYSLPSTNLSDYERQVNLDGTVDTITRSYYEVSLAPLPIVTSYPIDIVRSLTYPTSFYFQGTASISTTFSGSIITIVSGSHQLTGSILYGSIVGSEVGQTVWKPGDIYLPISITGSFNPMGSNVTFSGSFNPFTSEFDGKITFTPTSTNCYYRISFISETVTGSIFDEFATKTSGKLFALNKGVPYRKQIAIANTPPNETTLKGYFSTHYKYKKQIFSQKEINSYDQNSYPVKWKRGSQNKKTTVDESTGLLNNTDPVETKTT